MASAALPHNRVQQNQRPRPLALLVLVAALIGVVAALLLTSPWSGSGSAPAFSYQAEAIQMADRQRSELRAYFDITYACKELRPTWPGDECEQRILAANPGFKPGGYVDGPRILVPGGPGTEPTYGRRTIVIGEVSYDAHPAFPDIETACAELRPAWPLSLCLNRTQNDPENRAFKEGAYDPAMKIFIPGSASW